MKHDWYVIDGTVLEPVWRCRICGATTNNAFLMYLYPCEKKQ